MTLLEFLENYKMDLIDGVDSGICSQSEVEQVVDYIGELEQIQNELLRLKDSMKRLGLV